jgi:hypothetical protein
MTEEILHRFGILNRDDLEMVVVAEKDRSAWSNLKSEEEKSQDLTGKGEAKRISGKGMEGIDVESEEKEEDELEKELEGYNKDAEDVAGRELRQWTFWF